MLSKPSKKSKKGQSADTPNIPNESANGVPPTGKGKKKSKSKANANDSDNASQDASRANPKSPTVIAAIVGAIVGLMLLVGIAIVKRTQGKRIIPDDQSDYGDFDLDELSQASASFNRNQTENIWEDWEDQTVGFRERAQQERADLQNNYDAHKALES